MVTAPALDAFFADYAAAFNRLDGDAVAALWATPSGIRQGGALTWWADAAPMQDNHRKLCAIYRAAGMARCEPRVLQSLPLGAHDAFALVHWRLLRLDGSELQVFSTGYHLQRDADAGWRVLLVTAFSEDLAALRQAAPN
jgi:hypothetical protein